MYQRRRGYSLLVTAACLTVLIGMMGLAFDMGRMYIVKSEVQTFVDSAAVAAVRLMDGTKTGIQKAHTTATVGPLGSSTPNAWHFDTIQITAATDTYSTSFNGIYDNYPTAETPNTNSYRFLNLTASVTMPLYFLPAVPGIGTQQTVTASATAGQQSQTATFSYGGLAPFSPDAHNPSDTKNFGFSPGGQYTLKWGNKNATSCTGDAGFDPGNAPSQHGFVDLGFGNGNSALRSCIIWGGYPNASSTPNHVSVGDYLGGVPGNRGASIFSATAERSNQDPDQSSLTWDAYKAAGTGNGRRIITLPINDPAFASGNGNNAVVKIIGFGNFLLDPGNTISGNSGALCAIYIGPASVNSWSSGGTDGRLSYASTLFQ